MKKNLSVSPNYGLKIGVKMKKIFFTIILIFSSSVFSATLFPKACQVSGLRYHHDAVILFSQHTAKPRLYAIHNISKYPLWITHVVKNPSASAGWASALSPGHWSAILITEHEFNLVCQLQKKTGSMKNIPCSQVIRLCQFSVVNPAHPVDGSYWVVENVALHALVPKIRSRGL